MEIFRKVKLFQDSPCPEPQTGYSLVLFDTVQIYRRRISAMESRITAVGRVRRRTFFLLSTAGRSLPRLILLGETIGAMFWAGAAFILIGVLLVITGKNQTLE
jgi:hypothetical protein